MACLRSSCLCPRVYCLMCVRCVCVLLCDVVRVDAVLVCVVCFFVCACVYGLDVSVCLCGLFEV